MCSKSQALKDYCHEFFESLNSKLAAAHHLETEQPSEEQSLLIHEPVIKK